MPRTWRLLPFVKTWQGKDSKRLVGSTLVYIHTSLCSAGITENNVVRTLGLQLTIISIIY